MIRGLRIVLSYSLHQCFGCLLLKYVFRLEIIFYRPGVRVVQGHVANRYIILSHGLDNV
jgi:hypothetical protein